MAVNRDKVKKQMAENKQRSGKFRYLPKDSTTALRILEFKDEDGESIFARMFAEHRKADSTGGKALGVCREETFGQPCAFCKVNQKARESGEEWVYSTKRRYAVNAIDINDKTPQVRSWMLPVTAYEQIADYVMDDEYEDILEQKPGLPFNCKREGSGLDTEYTCKPKRSPYPVNAELMGQISDPAESFADPGLKSQCESLGYEIEDLFDDSEIEEAGKSEKSKTSSKKSKKTAKKKGGAGIKHDEAGIEVGSAVLFEEEEVEYLVKSIDGDNVEIEDGDGNLYDATADQLKLIAVEKPEPEEDEGEEVDTTKKSKKKVSKKKKSTKIEVGSEVTYLDETDICTVKSIDGKDVVIEDGNKDQFDAKLGELSLADIPF